MHPTPLSLILASEVPPKYELIFPWVGREKEPETYGYKIAQKRFIHLVSAHLYLFSTSLMIAKSSFSTVESKGSGWCSARIFFTCSFALSWMEGFPFSTQAS